MWYDIIFIIRYIMYIHRYISYYSNLNSHHSKPMETLENSGRPQCPICAEQFPNCRKGVGTRACTIARECSA